MKVLFITGLIIIGYILIKINVYFLIRQYEIYQQKKYLPFKTVNLSLKQKVFAKQRINKLINIYAYELSKRTRFLIDTYKFEKNEIIAMLENKIIQLKELKYKLDMCSLENEDLKLLNNVLDIRKHKLKLKIF